MELKRNTKYKSTIDIKDGCYMCNTPPRGNCGTCKYRDNMRSRDGFVRSDIDSGYYDWCKCEPLEGGTDGD